MKQEKSISAFTNEQPQNEFWRFLYTYKSATVKGITFENDTEEELEVALELFVYTHSRSKDIVRGTTQVLHSVHYTLPPKNSSTYTLDVAVPTGQGVGFQAQIMSPSGSKQIALEWLVETGGKRTLPSSSSYYSRLKKIQTGLYERAPSVAAYKSMSAYTNLLLHDDSFEDEFFSELQAQLEAGITPIIAEELGDSTRFYTRLFAEIQAVRKSLETRCSEEYVDYQRPYDITLLGQRPGLQHFTVRSFEPVSYENEELVSQSLLKQQLSTLKKAVLVVDLCGYWAGKIPSFDQNNYEFLKNEQVLYLCLDRAGKQELKQALHHCITQKGIEYAIFIRGESDVTDTLRITGNEWEKELYL